MITRNLQRNKIAYNITPHVYNMEVIIRMIFTVQSYIFRDQSSYRNIVHNITI